MIIYNNKKNKLSIALNCHKCGKKTRYTENSYFEKVIVPKGLIEINRNGEHHKTHYTYMWGNTKDEDIFGVVTMGNEVIDYKKYILEFGKKQEINNGNQKYSIDWAKQPDNVKIYADQSRSGFVRDKLIFNIPCRCGGRRCMRRRREKKTIKGNWEDLTTMPYDSITDKVISCYKCRKQQKTTPFVTFLEQR